MQKLTRIWVLASKASPQRTEDGKHCIAAHVCIYEGTYALYVHNLEVHGRFY